jgi:hypothetical protein
MEKMKDPLESKEQIALVRNFRNKGYFVFHVPNGGKRSMTEAIKMKAEGVVAGIPDLCMVLPEGKVIWIELKRRKGGTVSPVQKEVHKRLEELGHIVIVGYGAKDAMEKFKETLASL